MFFEKLAVICDFPAWNVDTFHTIYNEAFELTHITS